MTRKDCELLACALRTAYPYPAPDCELVTEIDVWQTTATRIADALETNNGRFDRERFLAACRPRDTA